MKLNNRLLLPLSLALALAFGGMSPARADEPPPADKGDIISLRQVMDLYPGSSGSTPSHITGSNTALYFSANSGNGLGRELWVYDSLNPISGSNPAVFDICLGNLGSSPTDLVVHNGELYFSADGCDGAGRELWKFTWISGVQRVADLAPGGTSSNPAFLVVYKGALYFRADGNDGAGDELWKYDTVSGALRVADIHPGSGSSLIFNLTVYNDRLYFAADGNDGAGYELWTYAAGAPVRVSDISEGITNSIRPIPQSFEVYEGSLFFPANGSDGAGNELWMFNEIDGIQRVLDIRPGLDSSDPGYMEVYNGALYFSAEGDDLAGVELWRYDPTSGARRVADITPGGFSSYPSYLEVFNGALYFAATADGPVLNLELWKYDNTTTALYRSSRIYDGWILESGENTNAGDTFNATQTIFNLGDNAQNKQYRSILSFNTSTLPDNAVIISATLKIRQQGAAGTNPFTTHGNILVDIIKGAFSGNNALQASDFQAAPGKGTIGVIRNLPDVNLWYITALNKLAFPHINKAGVTQLRLRFNKDDNNDNGADFLKFFSANSASMSDYPVLEVKYYIP